MLNKKILFLSDYFKKRYKKRVVKIPVWGPFSCPNIDGSLSKGGCTYCNMKSISPTWFKGSFDYQNQIIEGIKRARRKDIAGVIAYVQNHTPTYGKIEELRKILDVVRDIDDIVGISIASRPDTLSDALFFLLQKIRPRFGDEIWIEIGLEIADDRILKETNRAHTVDDFINAANRIKKEGFKLVTHILYGLPGETESSVSNTVQVLKETSPWGVKFHNLIVTKGTKIARDYLNGSFVPQQRDVYVKNVVRTLKGLPQNAVVHRLYATAKPNHAIAPEWSKKTHIIRREILSMLQKE